jgi:hypothetical protein
MGRPAKYETAMTAAERQREYRQRERIAVSPQELLRRVRVAAHQYEQAIRDYALAVASARDEFNSDDTVTKWLESNKGTWFSGDAKTLLAMGDDPQRAGDAALALVLGFKGVLREMRWSRVEEGDRQAILAEIKALQDRMAEIDAIIAENNSVTDDVAKPANGQSAPVR